VLKKIVIIKLAKNQNVMAHLLNIAANIALAQIVGKLFNIEQFTLIFIIVKFLIF
jgi:hypothetical protein